MLETIPHTRLLGFGPEQCCRREQCVFIVIHVFDARQGYLKDVFVG